MSRRQAHSSTLKHQAETGGRLRQAGARAGHQPPSTTQAHDTLTAALQEQANWEQRRRSAKELLNEMLASRREAAELAKSYDTRCARKHYASVYGVSLSPDCEPHCQQPCNLLTHGVLVSRLEGVLYVS